MPLACRAAKETDAACPPPPAHAGRASASVSHLPMPCPPLCFLGSQPKTQQQEEAGKPWLGTGMRGRAGPVGLVNPGATGSAPGPQGAGLCPALRAATPSPSQQCPAGTPVVTHSRSHRPQWQGGLLPRPTLTPQTSPARDRWCELAGGSVPVREWGSGPCPWRPQMLRRLTWVRGGRRPSWNPHPLTPPQACPERPASTLLSRVWGGTHSLALPTRHGTSSLPHPHCHSALSAPRRTLPGPRHRHHSAAHLFHGGHPKQTSALAGPHPPCSLPEALGALGSWVTFLTPANRGDAATSQLSTAACPAATWLPCHFPRPLGGLPASELGPSPASLLCPVGSQAPPTLALPGQLPLCPRLRASPFLGLPASPSPCVSSSRCLLPPWLSLPLPGTPSFWDLFTKPLAWGWLLASLPPPLRLPEARQQFSAHLLPGGLLLLAAPDPSHLTPGPTLC